MCIQYLLHPVQLTLITMAVYSSYTTFVTRAIDRGHPSWLLTLGFTEHMIFAMMITLVHTASYVVFGGSYLFIERSGLLLEFKIKREQYQEPDKLLLKELFKDAMSLHFVQTPIFMALYYPMYKYVGMPSLLFELPTFFSLWSGFAFCGVVSDVGFYWTHRAIHHPALYWIHKKHHEFTGTISFAAEFADPLESLLEAILPSMTAAMLMKSPFLVTLIWMSLRLSQVYEHHSGYCFYPLEKRSLATKIVLVLRQFVFCQFPYNAMQHDHHHTASQGNFGEPWLDWTFGTMDYWLALGGIEGYCEKTGFVAESARPSFAGVKHCKGPKMQISTGAKARRLSRELSKKAGPTSGWKAE